MVHALVGRRVGAATAAALALASALAGSGCTTKTAQMTDRYDAGDFVAAAIAGDETLAMLRDGDGVVVGIGARYERDRLWAGLEKAKILQDAARFRDSLDVYTWVYAEQDWLAELESNYAENPLNPSNWNAGQFLEDAGQTVVGADQTDYVVQPYEAILTASYASLVAMMLDEPRAADFARQSMTLQGQWRENLGLDLVGVREGPSNSIDSGLASRNPQLSGFSIASILNLDQFGKARSEMRQVVEAAVRVGAASPFLPAASLVNWAAFMKNDRYSDAITAAEGFKAFSGDAALANELRAAMDAPTAPDKVLVFVGAGRGPARDFFSVRIPVPIPTIATGYYRGVYPALKFRDGPTRPSRVTAAGTPLSVVGSIDAVAAQDFSRREPSLWWLPTFRGVLRTAASMAAQAVTRNENSLIGLGILAANVAVAEAEQPDLRMWTSLPAVFFAALVDRPESGDLEISLGSAAGANSIRVEVPEGLSMVYVRSLEPRLTVAHSTSIRRPTPRAAGAASVPAARRTAAAQVTASATMDEIAAPTLARHGHDAFVGIETSIYADDPEPMQVGPQGSSRNLDLVASEYADRFRRGIPASQAMRILAQGPVEAFDTPTVTARLGRPIDRGDQLIVVSAPQDLPALVKLVDSDDPGRLMTVFIPAARRANLRVVPGRYLLLAAIGRDWFGWECDFGPDAQYLESASPLIVRTGAERLDVQLGIPGTGTRFDPIHRSMFD